MFSAFVYLSSLVLQAAQKKERAENELAKLALKMTPAEAPIDREHISEEERYMFRKLGLRMKAFLLIGQGTYFISTLCIEVDKFSKQITFCRA